MSGGFCFCPNLPLLWEDFFGGKTANPLISALGKKFGMKTRSSGEGFMVSLIFEGKKITKLPLVNKLINQTSQLYYIINRYGTSMVFVQFCYFLFSVHLWGELKSEKPLFGDVCRQNASYTRLITHLVTYKMLHTSKAMIIHIRGAQNGIKKALSRPSIPSGS